MHLIATSSGLLSASAVIFGRPCRFLGVQLLADATHAATATVYDNATTNSGLVVGAASVKAGDTQEASAAANISAGVMANKGLYLALTGTGATAIVYYAPVS